MPLRDHFRPSLSGFRDLHAFHTAWASNLTFDLNARLPPDHFAEPHVHFTDTADVVEVSVYRRRSGGWSLSGLVELVTPWDKDRPANRVALVEKCEAFLRDGVGLAVVDGLTDTGENLHDELMARMSGSDAGPAWGVALYATAYRAAGRNGEGELAIWQESLAVGQPLPTLPLWLEGGGRVDLRLEATYEQTCERLRYPPTNVT